MQRDINSNRCRTDFDLTGCHVHVAQQMQPMISKDVSALPKNEAPKCWRVQIPSKQTGNRWWIGVISSQPPFYSNCYSKDGSLSMCYVDSLLLESYGGILFNGAEIDAMKIDWYHYPTELTIHCDPIGKRIVFVRGKDAISVGGIPFDLGQSKPIVQLRATGTNNIDKITILPFNKDQGHLFDKGHLFDECHLCPVSDTNITHIELDQKLTDRIRRIRIE